LGATAGAWGASGVALGATGAVGGTAELLGEPQGLLGEPQGLLGKPQGLLEEPQGLFREPQGLFCIRTMKNDVTSTSTFATTIMAGSHTNHANSFYNLGGLGAWIEEDPHE
jgi:hypothetical protein